MAPSKNVEFQNMVKLWFLGRADQDEILHGRFDPRTVDTTNFGNIINLHGRTHWGIHAKFSGFTVHGRQHASFYLLNFVVFARQLKRGASQALQHRRDRFWRRHRNPV